LSPYAEWLEKRAEQVRETRIIYPADSRRAVLRLYRRSQAAEFGPQVSYAFAFLADYFGAGKKKGKKEQARFEAGEE
jgi:P pilus assembly chaperone PapD